MPDDTSITTTTTGNGGPLSVSGRGLGKRPGLLRRTGTATRRWARDTFNREQIVAGLKQLAWVAPLTMLIWLYAERAQQSEEMIPVHVRARSSNDKVHLKLVEP